MTMKNEPQTTQYAIFKKGRQVSKPCPDYRAAEVEAYQNGNAIMFDNGKIQLDAGFKIDEAKHVQS